MAGLILVSTFANRNLLSRPISKQINFSNSKFRPDNILRLSAQLSASPYVLLIYIHRGYTYGLIIGLCANAEGAYIHPCCKSSVKHTQRPHGYGERHIRPHIHPRFKGGEVEVFQ